MIYGILCATGILVCFVYNLLIEENDRSLVKIILQANNLFCIQYLIFSCPFLFLEKFAVWKPIAILIILDIGVIGYKCVKQQRPFIFYNKCIARIIEKDELFALIIILLCTPLISVTTENIQTISDQGAYSLHTSILIREKNSQLHKLSELGLSEEIDIGLRELQQDMLCYFYDSSNDTYYIHALSTWCVIPALFGKIFGFWKRMVGINYIWVLTVFTMFYVCKQIQSNRYGKYMSLGLFASAPLVLYIGKAGLSEIMILWLVVAGLECILKTNNKQVYLGAIYIGMIGFVHISMFLYLPIVTLVFFLMAIDQDDKKWAICNMIQLMMFGISVWYCYKISPVYVQGQYKIFTLNGIISYRCLFVIISLLLLLFCIVQCHMLNKDIVILKGIKDFIFKNFRWIVLTVFIVIFFKTVFYGYNLCFTYNCRIPEEIDAGSWNLRNRYINIGWKGLSYLNITNIARATGMVGLVVFCILPFRRQEMSNREKIFYLLELYGLFYYLVIRMDTPFNYYASRYFIPLIVPMITVILASCIKKECWSIYALTLALLFNRYYWPSFLVGGPQVGQYKILQDAMNMIPEEAVVCCDVESKTINTTLTSNLRILNNNKVFNLNNIEEIEEQFAGCDIFIISEKELLTSAELILENSYTTQYSFGNGANGSYDTKVFTYEIPLYIYKLGFVPNK